jgi:hypothetical protein
MTEEQLRALVRDAVARHLAHSGAATPAAEPSWKTHASHVRLAVFSGGDTDGPCLIEPRVPCNHCGYCQSFGH